MQALLVGENKVLVSRKEPFSTPLRLAPAVEKTTKTAC